MESLYPLKFETIFKEKLWGGHKIKSILEKDFGTLANCGETWEVSGVSGNISVVSNGVLKGKKLTEVINSYQEQLLGQKVWNQFGNKFPLLIKFLDAAQDLSIQVHPNDELAKARHNENGKTEMWYILQADEDAKLISGFNQPMNKTKYLEYFNNGKLMDILNNEPVQKNDVFFLPSGRVHTIGKGILLAEIQQTSDITYRIYDFDRIDSNGQKRELHVEDALDAIDYTYHEQYKTAYTDKINEQTDIVQCQYFTTNKLHYTNTTTRDYSTLESFVIFICFEGQTTLNYENNSMIIQKGDVILLPACIKEVELVPSPEFQILEVYIP